MVMMKSSAARARAKQTRAEKSRPQVHVVEVDGEIRLGQFLKLANVADTGGMARELIAEGMVSVNGEVDTRRGRQLAIGDAIVIDTGEQQVHLQVG